MNTRSAHNSVSIGWEKMTPQVDQVKTWVMTWLSWAVTWFACNLKASVVSPSLCCIGNITDLNNFQTQPSGGNLVVVLHWKGEDNSKLELRHLKKNDGQRVFRHDEFKSGLHLVLGEQWFIVYELGFNLKLVQSADFSALNNAGSKKCSYFMFTSPDSTRFFLKLPYPCLACIVLPDTTYQVHDQWLSLGCSNSQELLLMLLSLAGLCFCDIFKVLYHVDAWWVFYIGLRPEVD